jgi:hypothetical protein
VTEVSLTDLPTRAGTVHREHPGPPWLLTRGFVA